MDKKNDRGEIKKKTIVEGKPNRIKSQKI